MAAHRYWRIYSLCTLAEANTDLVEVSMAASTGGANLLGSGTASADSYYSGCPPSAACDGSTSTVWQSNTTGSWAWWAYDFGSGNAYAVAEVKITASSNATYAPRNPAVWELDYSDDGSTWTAINYYASADWVANTVQTFEVTGPPAAGQIWRINVASTVNGTITEIAEVSMASFSGGSNLIGSGTAYADSTYAGITSSWPAAAVDGNAATYWANNNSGAPAWWQYDFGSVVNIVEVKITAPSSYPSAAPGVWALQKSDGSGGFTTVASFTSATWTSNSTQTFDAVTTYTETLTESGDAVDTRLLAARVSVSESGAATDALGLTASHSLAESGSASDSVTAVGPPIVRPSIPVFGSPTLLWDPLTGTADLAMSGAALLVGHDLETAVIISLFTDAQADAGDLVYDPDPRGWWADTYAVLEDPALPALPNDRIGSKLWQVFVRPRNQDTLNWFADQASQSLDWMISDGVASAVDVVPQFTGSGGIGAVVTITANGVPTVYNFAWAQEV